MRLPSPRLASPRLASPSISPPPAQAPPPPPSSAHRPVRGREIDRPSGPTHRQAARPAKPKIVSPSFPKIAAPNLPASRTPRGKAPQSPKRHATHVPASSTPIIPSWAGQDGKRADHPRPTPRRRPPPAEKGLFSAHSSRAPSRSRGADCSPILYVPCAELGRAGGLLEGRRAEGGGWRRDACVRCVRTVRADVCLVRVCTRVSLARPSASALVCACPRDPPAPAALLACSGLLA